MLYKDKLMELFTIVLNNIYLFKEKAGQAFHRGAKKKRSPIG
jgi:hypothetical protein